MKKLNIGIVSVVALAGLLLLGATRKASDHTPTAQQPEPAPEVKLSGPTLIYQKTILPELDSTYELGTSTKAWLRGNFDILCLTADDCITEWPAGSGSGISSLNGLTDEDQTFSTSTADGGFGFLSATGVHTLNLPTAKATNPLGLLSAADWSTFNAKVSATRALTVNGTANQVSSSAGAQDLSNDRTWTLSLPSHVIFPGSFLSSFATITNATTTNLHITSLTSALLQADANGKVDEYAGTTCTNQFVRALSALGVATCATVDISADTNLAATWPVTQSGDTLGFNGLSTSTAAVVGNLPYFSGVNTFANVATGTLAASGGLTVTGSRYVVGGSATVDCTVASGSAAGCLSTTDWNTFNGKESALTFTWPLIRTTNTISFGGLSTSTAAVRGNIPYFSGVNTFANIGTTTPTVTSPITYSGTLGSFIGGAAGTFGCATCVTTSRALTVAGTANQITSSAGSQDLSADRTWTLSLPNHVIFPGSFLSSTATITNATTTNLFATRFVGKTNASFTPFAEGEIGLDTTSNQLKYFSGSAVRVIPPQFYPAFTYPTSTAWTGTTTFALGPSYIAETWAGVKCQTNPGATLNVSFQDATTSAANKMNLFNASNTVGTVNLTTNNAFTASEPRWVAIGTPVGSPTFISCTVSKSYDAD